MSYEAQYTPGETAIAQNRRNHQNPDNELRKIREISDENVVKLLGHRAPGESYKSVHPPLDEMEFADDPMKDLVEPIQGAKDGVRIRYIQFTDSMYNAPAQPFDRARTYMRRFPGVDTGTLSGRQVVEMRESDLEAISKILLETDLFDSAKTGLRGATVHGHALRLDENGLMFDALQRYKFNEDTGTVVYVKQQVGVPLDEPVDVGKPLDEAELAKITTIYRKDNIGMREDKEAIEVTNHIHFARTRGGFGLDVFKDDFNKRLGDD